MAYFSKSPEFGTNFRREVLLFLEISEYEVKGARPRGRPKKTWREIVEKDCRAHGLYREDAVDCIRWKNQIRDD